MLAKAPEHPNRYTNKILQRLSADTLHRLSLRPVHLPVPRDIESPGRPIDHVVFLESGAASTTTTFEDGSQVEVGLLGAESILGVSALMGTKRSLNRTYIQISGHGFAAPMATARVEFRLGGAFQILALAASRLNCVG